MTKLRPPYEYQIDSASGGCPMRTASGRGGSNRDWRPNAVNNPPLLEPGHHRPNGPGDSAYRAAVQTLMSTF